MTSTHSVNGKRYRVHWLRVIVILAAVVLIAAGITRGMGQQPEAVSLTPDIPITTAQPSKQQQPKQRQMIYNVPLDPSIQKLIIDRCAALGLDERMVFGLIHQESHFKNCVSADGQDFGLMQINKVNIDRLADEVGARNVMDERDNILMGTQYLKEITDYWKARGFNGEALESAVLSTYNRGYNGFSRDGAAEWYVKKIRQYKGELRSVESQN